MMKYKHTFHIENSVNEHFIKVNLYLVLKHDLGTSSHEDVIP